MINKLVAVKYLKRILVFQFFISCLIVTSCYKKSDEIIDVSDAVPLSLAPDVTWAVISDPYAAFKDDKSWDAETNGYCRKGDILKVDGKSTDETGTIWYKFANGWLPASSLSVYNNRYKAQSVAKSYDDSLKR